MIGNTAPFDLTHHPAMSLPCGMVDGLPVGLMLVGKHFDEPTIYRAGLRLRAVRRLEKHVSSATAGSPSNRDGVCRPELAVCSDLRVMQASRVAPYARRDAIFTQAALTKNATVRLSGQRLVCKWSETWA